MSVTAGQVQDATWANARPLGCTSEWSQRGLVLWLKERVHLQCTQSPCLPLHPTSKLVQGSFSYSAGNPGTSAKGVFVSRGHLTPCCSVLSYLAMWHVSCLPEAASLVDRGLSEVAPQICSSHLTQPALCSPTECLLSTGDLLLGEPRPGCSVTALCTYLSPLLGGHLPRHRGCV